MSPLHAAVTLISLGNGRKPDNHGASCRLATPRQTQHGPCFRAPHQRRIPEFPAPQVQTCADFRILVRRPTGAGVLDSTRSQQVELDPRRGYHRLRGVHVPGQSTVGPRQCPRVGGAWEKITASLPGIPSRLGIATSSLWSSRPWTLASAAWARVASPGRELRNARTMTAHFARFRWAKDSRRIEHLWQTMYRGAYFEGGRSWPLRFRPSISRSGTSWVRPWVCRSTNLLGSLPSPRRVLRHPRVLNGPRCVERARELADQGWRLHALCPRYAGIELVRGVGRDLRAVRGQSRRRCTGWGRSGEPSTDLGSSLSIDFVVHRCPRGGGSSASGSRHCTCTRRRGADPRREPGHIASCAA